MTSDKPDDDALIRAALAPDARDVVRATWQDIEARAAATAAADADADRLHTSGHAGPARPAVAANDPWPLRKLAWAAAVLLGVGLASLMLSPGPESEPALRGVGGQPSPGPRWLVDHPQQAAEALAAELRSLGAEVGVTGEQNSAVLTIQARPDAVNAVNARLSALETGLDADGRLTLTVAARR